LNWRDAVFLLSPPVGLVLHPVEKCGALSVGRGTRGSSVPRRWTFVFRRCRVPAPLPRTIIGGSMRRTSGCLLSTVYNRRAKRAFISSSAAIAKGSPESRKSVTIRVVRHTSSTPLVASVIVLSIMLTCYPTRALTLTSLSTRYSRGCLCLPPYYASVP
jgi:hypothetical protein